MRSQTIEQTASERFVVSLDLSRGVETVISAGKTLDDVAREFSNFGQSFAALLSEMSQYGFRPGAALTTAIICLAIAVLAELYVRRIAGRIMPSSSRQAAGWIFWRLASETAAIVTFGLLTFLPLLILLRDDPVASAIMVALLPALLVLRAADAVLRLVLGPFNDAARLVALDSNDARRLYVSVLIVAVPTALAFVSARLLAQGGLAEITVLAYMFVTRVLVTTLVLGALFANRNSIAQLLSRRRNGTMRSGAWQRFGASWHLFAACYIGLSFLGASVLLLTGIEAANAAAQLSFVAILLALLAALWLDSAFHLTNESDGVITPAGSGLIQNIALRTGVPSVIGALIITLLAIWSPIWSEATFLDISPPVRAALLQIGVTIFLTFVLWQVVNAVSAQYGATAQGLASLSETGVSSRFGTLVPLFKVLLLIGLVFVSAISALAALGVDVLPLFAGAGIVGLAIGLGSQTLVRDVVSGIFFLIDDAFRIGEYVDVGNAKGTVEHVSIRSMRLRHHMGTVHTIPYGEIATIANMSRDWVVMRVEFRVPFDVDTEEFRKKIKGLGKTLAEDPELGPKFLEPLKSAGVVGIEEAAMIIRCKFTARPGDQWELRRIVYEELRRLFAREGITVAVRQVHVRAPDSLPAPTATAQAGAADTEA
ncbi:MAG: mechanosensitive ion channel family protein [Roseobacter sp.]